MRFAAGPPSTAMAGPPQFDRHNSDQPGGAICYRCQASSIRALALWPWLRRIRYQGANTVSLERSVVQPLVPLELVETGEQALSEVESCVVAGMPVVTCLLLASSFYEALKTELRRTDRADYQKKAILAAAAEQCSRTAFVTISPEAVLNELRAA